MQLRVQPPQELFPQVEQLEVVVTTAGRVTQVVFLTQGVAVVVQEETTAGAEQVVALGPQRLVLARLQPQLPVAKYVLQPQGAQVLNVGGRAKPPEGMKEDKIGRAP